jgi:CheY-like chemotaxis protein
LGARRILIVDGDDDSRAVYRIMLQHHGYEVLESERGDGVLEVLEREVVDAIVMELTLQGTDGHCLLRRLRSEPRFRDLCVIVATARALKSERAQAESNGCTLFLAKPVEPHELIRRVRALVGG